MKNCKIREIRGPWKCHCKLTAENIKRCLMALEYVVAEKRATLKYWQKKEKYIKDLQKRINEK